MKRMSASSALRAAAAALVVAFCVSAYGWWSRGPTEVEIIPYVGWANATRVYVRGRVLKRRKKPQQGNALLANIKRFFTHEIEYATIQVHFEGRVFSAKTDDEGFFRAEIQRNHRQTPHKGFLAARFELAPTPKYTAKAVEGKIVAMGSRTRLGVISDIDDTVFRMDVAHKTRMLKRVFLGSAETREVFRGVPHFYRGLHEGATGAEWNPFFYVSGSPQNFYDLLLAAFERNGVPIGHFDLKDLGMDSEADPLFGQRKYKSKRIAEVLGRFPGLSFICIGDSEEKDPETYAQFASEPKFRGRILAVYIRDLSDMEDSTRIKELRALQKRVGADRFVLAENTSDMAAHACKHGWISAAARDRVFADTCLSGSLPGREGEGTRYPIVLAHGLLGFGELGVGRDNAKYYFKGVREDLTRLGYNVFITKVGDRDGIAVRAEQLKRSINRITSGKVNIIAHSMGGLDARYMISHLGMAKRVASLTTIATPHRGSSYADWAVKNAGAAIKLLKVLGIQMQAILDLTTEACRRFNETTPDAPGVKYISYSGSQPHEKICSYLRLPHKIIFKAEGPNDGLVSVRSAKWGEYRGNIPADHLNQICRKGLFEKHEEFDGLRFYRKLAEDLRREGL